MKKKLFTRAQGKGIQLRDMQRYRSIHGWDEDAGDFLRLDGLACCNGLASDMNFGNSDTSDETAEIVVFAGEWIENIYDGCVAYPTEIVRRFTCSEYEQLSESGELWDMFDESEYEF